jgi:hypothetical protein
MVWPIKLLWRPNGHDATLRFPWKRHFGQPRKAPRRRTQQVPDMGIGKLGHRQTWPSPDLAISGLGHRQKAAESGNPRATRLLLLFKGSTK